MRAKQRGINLNEECPDSTPWYTTHPSLANLCEYTPLRDLGGGELSRHPEFRESKHFRPRFMEKEAKRKTIAVNAKLERKLAAKIAAGKGGKPKKNKYRLHGSRVVIVPANQKAIYEQGAMPIPKYITMDTFSTCNDHEVGLAFLRALPRATSAQLQAAAMGYPTEAMLAKRAARDTRRRQKEKRRAERWQAYQDKIAAAGANDGRCPTGRQSSATPVKKIRRMKSRARVAQSRRDSVAAVNLGTKKKQMGRRWKQRKNHHSHHSHRGDYGHDTHQNDLADDAAFQAAFEARLQELRNEESGELILSEADAETKKLAELRAAEEQAEATATAVEAQARKHAAQRRSSIAQHMEGRRADLKRRLAKRKQTLRIKHADEKAKSIESILAKPASPALQELHTRLRSRIPKVKRMHMCLAKLDSDASGEISISELLVLIRAATRDNNLTADSDICTELWEGLSASESHMHAGNMLQPGAEVSSRTIMQWWHSGPGFMPLRSTMFDHEWQDAPEHKAGRKKKMPNDNNSKTHATTTLEKHAKDSNNNNEINNKGNTNEAEEDRPDLTVDRAAAAAREAAAAEAQANAAAQAAAVAASRAEAARIREATRVRVAQEKRRLAVKRLKKLAMHAHHLNADGEAQQQAAHAFVLSASMQKQNKDSAQAKEQERMLEIKEVEAAKAAAQAEEKAAQIAQRQREEAERMAKSAAQAAAAAAAAAATKAEKASAAGAAVELRISPEDGLAYAKEDFLDYYGDSKVWDTARAANSKERKEWEHDMNAEAREEFRMGDGFDRKSKAEVTRAVAKEETALEAQEEAKSAEKAAGEKLIAMREEEQAAKKAKLEAELAELRLAQKEASWELENASAAAMQTEKHQQKSSAVPGSAAASARLAALKLEEEQELQEDIREQRLRRTKRRTSSILAADPSPRLAKIHATLRRKVKSKGKVRTPLAMQFFPTPPCVLLVCHTHNFCVCLLWLVFPDEIVLSKVG